MNNLSLTPQDYLFDRPALPGLEPLMGVGKLWETENDYSYLKFLYPDICTKASEYIEDECDRLEYDGSFIFDSYPDKVSLQRLAMKILKKCHEKAPDTYPLESPHIREIIEILLYQEILFRRNRYRNRKRLYL